MLHVVMHRDNCSVDFALLRSTVKTINGPRHGSHRVTSPAQLIICLDVLIKAGRFRITATFVNHYFEDLMTPTKLCEGPIVAAFSHYTSSEQVSMEFKGTISDK